MGATTRRKLQQELFFFSVGVFFSNMANKKICIKYIMKLLLASAQSNCIGKQFLFSAF